GTAELVGHDRPMGCGIESPGVRLRSSPSWLEIAPFTARVEEAEWLRRTLSYLRKSGRLSMPTTASGHAKRTFGFSAAGQRDCRSTNQNARHAAPIAIARQDMIRRAVSLSFRKKRPTMAA